MESVLDQVERGESLAWAARAVGGLPRTFTWGLEVGERRGDLPRILDELADLYTVELELTQEAFLALLGPVAIILVGNIVGAVVVWMMLLIREIQNEAMRGL
jgi:type II secretory pathway component PulF